MPEDGNGWQQHGTIPPEIEAATRSAAANMVSHTQSRREAKIETGSSLRYLTDHVAHHNHATGVSAHSRTITLRARLRPHAASPRGDF